MLRLMDMIIIVKSYAIVENGVRDIMFSAFVTCWHKPVNVYIELPVETKSFASVWLNQWVSFHKFVSERDLWKTNWHEGWIYLK